MFWKVNTTTSWGNPATSEVERTITEARDLDAAIKRVVHNKLSEVYSLVSHTKLRKKQITWTKYNKRYLSGGYITLTEDEATRIRRYIDTSTNALVVTVINIDMIELDDLEKGLQVSVSPHHPQAFIYDPNDSKKYLSIDANTVDGKTQWIITANGKNSSIKVIE